MRKVTVTEGILYSKDRKRGRSSRILTEFTVQLENIEKEKGFA
jgi:hypothetical protein